MKNVCLVVLFFFSFLRGYDILHLGVDWEGETGLSTFEQIRNDGMNQRVTITFSELPKDMDGLNALPESERTTPFQTAALTICALCAYVKDAENGLDMIGLLKGSAVFSGKDREVLKERLEGKAYLPFSYFTGATPENAYTPETPYRLTFTTNPFSFSEHGFVRLFVSKEGAGAKKAITLRQQENQWMLWEYASLLTGVVPPVVQ